MRKRADRVAAICAIGVVATVPAVMTATSWHDGTGSDPRSASGRAAAAGDPAPSPGGAPPAARPYGSGPYGSGPYGPAQDGSGRDAGSPGARGAALEAAGTRVSSLRRASDGARITAVRSLARREVDLSVRSPALGSTQKVRLLLPAGWKARTKRTWPILYAYHGGRDSYVSWTRSTDIESLARRYNVIVAMPEGDSGAYTNWYNYGRGGIPKWETFHLSEVRQLLERNFHAGRTRAAMGLSSGGQGAVTYAARHPGFFRYAASYSGVLSLLSPGVPTLLMYTMSKEGHDPRAVWGDPVLNRDVWEAHDPASLVDRLRGTKLYVSSGNGLPGDYDAPDKPIWNIGYFSETQVLRDDLDFVVRAQAAGVPLTTHFYGNGSHSWPYWQREMHRNWPAIMKSIGARKL